MGRRHWVGKTRLEETLGEEEPKSGEEEAPGGEMNQVESSSAGRGGGVGLVRRHGVRHGR